MDNNSQPARRKRKLLNLFDVIIIVVVLAAVAIVFLISAGKKNTNAAVTYAVELTYMEEGTAKLIKPGDTLRDNVKKYTIGKVVAVEIEPTQRACFNSIRGEYFFEEVPGYENAIVTLEATCFEDEQGYTVDGGYEVRVGKSVSLSGPGYSGAGYVITMEEGN